MTAADSPASTGSAAPVTMEAYRHAIFRAMIVRRMEAAKAAGKPLEQITAAIAREQRALADALCDPAVIAVASRALGEAQAAILADPRYRSTPGQLQETMYQIMVRRAAEASQFADLLSQPDYVVALAATSVAAASAAVPLLHDVKIREVLGDLLHLENGAPQVIAHIDAAAKGAMIEHDALARVFAADGALAHALMDALANRLPAQDRQEIQSLVSDWLGARAAAAKMTSDLSAPDGAAYLEAVRQSTEWHRARQSAAIPDVAVSAVSPIIAPEAAQQKPASARELEKAKTSQRRAEDVAYTINHALSCGTTDVLLQPLIAAATGLNVGCSDPSHREHHGHDHHEHNHNHHGHDHHGRDHHGCDHHGRDHSPKKRKLTWKTFAHEAGHYLKGEIIGDVVAVPLTSGVQRLFPNFMNGLRNLLEPLVGWAFRGGANRTARNWAQNQGLAADAPEVKSYAEEVYQHEMSHLPQAVVWNMFAYPIGAVVQKKTGHNRSYPEIFKSKAIGAVVSNGLLIGGRMMAPGLAQKWDAAMGERVLLPVGKKVGKLFGVDEKTMEHAANRGKRHEAATWALRVADEPQADDSRQATRNS
jgi:hypothetical protein